jgi:NitT/TauT family transport system ATP-binding protein
MRQRVAIARALAPDPEVLLMDEPFNALDAQTRDIMQDEVISVWEATKKAIIFVTHNIDEAVFLADEIIVLTPRPAQVKAVHQVNFKRPRDRTGLWFQKIKKRILKQISSH